MVLVQFIELKPRSHTAVDKGQVNTISAIRGKLGNSPGTSGQVSGSKTEEAFMTGSLNR